MPTDQFIEQITDGTPSVGGDLYAVQRQVDGVWTDYFIRAENIGGGALLEADITLTNLAPGFTQLLPQLTSSVAPFAVDRVYAIVGPVVIHVTDNTPTLAEQDIQITQTVGSGIQILYDDTDEEMILCAATLNPEFGTGSGALVINQSALTGATVRVRFTYSIANI